jgi:hypothetical protein
VDADLDTLATALYVKINELLQRVPQLAPWRPRVGIAPKLTDAELVTLAVLQALLGFCSEARWLRYAHLGQLFPTCPSSPATTSACVGLPTCSGRSSACWPPTPAGGPTTCGLPTPPRWNVAAPGRPPSGPSWPAGPSTATAPATRAGSGAAPAPGLHPAGPAGRLRAGRRKADERQVLLGILAADSALVAARPGQTLISDKHHYGREFEAILAGLGVRLLRPAARASPSGPARICSARCGR